jgi:hypothetical protein
MHNKNPTGESNLFQFLPEKNHSRIKKLEMVSRSWKWFQEAV